MKKIIDKSKVDFFIATNSQKFEPTAMMSIKEKLERMDEDQFMIIQAGDFRDPTVILLIAIFLGWERFFIDDAGMGILKILTCYGLGIWWLIDLFTATERTKRYNYKRFMQLANYMQ